MSKQETLKYLQALEVMLEKRTRDSKNPALRSDLIQAMETAQRCVENANDSEFS